MRRGITGAQQGSQRRWKVLTYQYSTYTEPQIFASSLYRITHFHSACYKYVPSARIIASMVQWQHIHLLVYAAAWQRQALCVCK